MQNFVENSGVKMPSYLAKILRLILALTPKQKQDFKKSAAFYGNKKEGLGYLILYDLINECIEVTHRQVEKLAPSADETPRDQFAAIFSDIFFKKFLKPQKIKQQDLSRLCGYLHPRILESVRYQNESKNLTHELLSMLKDIQFLWDKDLFFDCKELIFKAKARAESLSLFELHSHLLRMERLIFMKVQNEAARENLHEKLRSMAATELNVLEKQRRLMQLRATNHESLSGIWTRKVVEADPSFAQYLNDFAQDFSAEPEDLGVDGQVLWHNTMANFSVLSWRHPSHAYRFLRESGQLKTLGHQRKIVELLIAHPEDLRESPNRIIHNLVNYLLQCIYLNRRDPEIFEYLEKYDTKNLSELTFLKTVAYIRLSMFLMGEPEFEKSVEWIEQNQLWQRLVLHRAEIPKPQLQSIYFLGGLVYCMKNDWKEAEKWLEPNERDDLKVANHASLTASAYLLLIARLERGVFRKHLYKETILKNFQQRLREINREVDDFDRAFVRFFGEMIDFSTSPTAMQKLAEQHLKNFEDLVKRLKQPKSHQTILAWIEAKANNLSFEKVVLRRLNEFVVVPIIVHHDVI